MTLHLHNLTQSPGTTQTRKRIGRGNGSGIGTYSGKGLKGQKSRSGVSGLKRLGMKSMLLSVPKKRGFTSRFPKHQVVNLEALNETFKAGAVVSPKALRAVGLVAKMTIPVKILGEGELKIDNLTFENVAVSQSAKEQIVKHQGIIK
ncbi:MAG: 50S ribosomal protein L15 [bacterium]